MRVASSFRPDIAHHFGANPVRTFKNYYKKIIELGILMVSEAQHKTLAQHCVKYCSHVLLLFVPSRRSLRRTHTHTHIKRMLCDIVYRRLSTRPMVLVVLDWLDMRQ